MVKPELIQELSGTDSGQPAYLECFKIIYLLPAFLKATRNG